MSGASVFVKSSGAYLRKGSGPRRVLRIVLPLVMLGFGAYVVLTAGLQGFIALLPILGAHVLGILVIYPLWVRYRRGRAGRAQAFHD